MSRIELNRLNRPAGNKANVLIHRQVKRASKARTVSKRTDLPHKSRFLYAIVEAINKKLDVRPVARDVTL